MLKMLLPRLPLTSGPILGGARSPKLQQLRAFVTLQAFQNCFVSGLSARPAPCAFSGKSMRGAPLHCVYMHGSGRMNPKNGPRQAHGVFAHGCLRVGQQGATKAPCGCGKQLL